MNALTTAGIVVRGLASRASLTLGTLGLVVVAVAATLLGPAFQQASVESYTLGRLDQASDLQTALTWTARRTSPDVPLDELVASATARAVAEAPGVFDPPEATLVSDLPADIGEAPDARFVARDGACDLLSVTGRCPRRAGEVLVNEVDLGSRAIGDTIEVARLGPQVIVGAYRTPTTSDDWLLPGRLASTPESQLSAARPGPYLVTTEAFAGLPVTEQVVVLDSRLQVPDAITDAELDAVVREVDRVADARFVLDGDRGRGVLVGASDLNNLDTVLVEIRAQRSAAGDAVAPAVVALVLVALAMLLRLMSAAAEARVPELALAGLRGVGARRTWLLGLAEPALILLLGAPLGLLVGFLAARGLVAQWLRPAVAVHVPPWSLLAAGLVVLAVAATATLAVGGSLRATLSDRLLGVRRPRAGSRASAAVELVLVSAAVVLPLSQLGDDSQGLDTGTLLLPVVLAIAAGLLVTRLATWATGAWARRHTTGTLSWFVAVRALSRRGQGTLVMLPVAAAIAVAVFAAGVGGAASDWRASVSTTRTPAPVVYSSPLALDDTLALTRRLDPDGRWMMTAARTSVASGSLVLVDTTRLAGVATWSEQWLPGRSAADVQELLAPTATPRLTSADVSLTVTNDARERTPLTVQLDVYEPGAGLVRAYLGPYLPGTSTRSARVVECAAGCDLRAVTVGGGAVASSLPLHGSLTLADLTSSGSLRTGALAATAWTADSDEVGVADAPGGLRLDVDTGDGSGTASIASAALRTAIPVLVGTGVGSDETVTVVDGETVLQDFRGTVPVDVVGRPYSTPFLGPRGTLLDLVQAEARLALTGDLTTSYVLLADDVPPALVDDLAAAGLAPLARAAETRAELDAGAYAQALRLYEAVGAVILLMALGGLVVSLAVQLPARRRDAASLRVVGVRPRTIAWATWWESVVTLGGAAVAGLVAGLLAQLLLLRGLTLGVVDEVTTPEVRAGVDLGGLVTLVAAIVAVLLVVAVTSSTVVLRNAGGASLRESAR